MRRLQALLLLIAAASATACNPFAMERSKARVSEIEVSLRSSGSTVTSRIEVDYLSDGRIDEITTTSGGNFSERLELSYDANNRVEEAVTVSDDDTAIIELTYTGELLTEMRKRTDDDDRDERWDLSYFHGDRRLVESIVVTVDSATMGLFETATDYAYDESSRIKDYVVSTFSESPSGDTSEMSTETDLRYDSETGKLDRITTTNEYLYYPDPVSDSCFDLGYYGDGYCDSTCPQPDPDCGGGGTIEAPTTEPEVRRETVLYSAKYDDKGRLEDLDGPSGATVTVDYDQEGRIDEIELRDGTNTWLVEYSYDEGTVSGHTFAPQLPAGAQFFDLAGSSFGTLDLESPLSVMGY